MTELARKPWPRRSSMHCRAFSVRAIPFALCRYFSKRDGYPNSLRGLYSRTKRYFPCANVFRPSLRRYTSETYPFFLSSFRREYALHKSSPFRSSFYLIIRMTE